MIVVSRWTSTASIFRRHGANGNFAAAARERGLEPRPCRARCGARASPGLPAPPALDPARRAERAGALYLARIQTALDDLETGAEEARALSVGPTGFFA